MNYGRRCGWVVGEWEGTIAGYVDGDLEEIWRHVSRCLAMMIDIDMMKED